MPTVLTITAPKNVKERVESPIVPPLSERARRERREKQVRQREKRERRRGDDDPVTGVTLLVGVCRDRHTRSVGTDFPSDGSEIMIIFTWKSLRLIV